MLDLPVNSGAYRDVPIHSRATAKRLHVMRMKDKNQRTKAAREAMQKMWNKAKTK